MLDALQVDQLHEGQLRAWHGAVNEAPGLGLGFRRASGKDDKKSAN
jgi:hypothetical protein